MEQRSLQKSQLLHKSTNHQMEQRSLQKFWKSWKCLYEEMLSPHGCENLRGDLVGTCRQAET